MEKISLRLPHDDMKKLEELAEKNATTASEIIRELIRNGYERHSASTALEEIRAAMKSLAGQKGERGSTEDIAEIRRIVTLIARAMPAVAKHV